MVALDLSSAVQWVLWSLEPQDAVEEPLLAPELSGPFSLLTLT